MIVKDIKIDFRRVFTSDGLIGIFLFLSTLLIGADLFGVDVLGFNVRIDQLFLAVLAVLLVLRGRFSFHENIFMIAFLAFSLISTLFAFSKTRAVFYYVSIVYNAVFLFWSYASYVRYYGLMKFMRVFRATCYTMFVIFIIQYALVVLTGREIPFMPSYGEFMGIPRFRLWFYEPSYMATYLSAWMAVSAYMWLIGEKKSYLADTVICVLMLALSTASTGYVAIAFVIVVVYVMWISKGLSVKKLIFPLVCLVLVGVFALALPDVFGWFVGRLFNSSLDDASGGRISQWAETFGVFASNPFFGVGPGCYGLYLGLDAGHVPSNVTLDLMATVGIFATIAFYGLTVWQIWKSVRIYLEDKNAHNMLLVAWAFGLLTFTLILQANQGYLRLYHWMILGIIEGGILETRRFETGERNTLVIKVR